MIRELETLRAIVPFGVRFWDSVLDAQIRDDLMVTAWPESGVGRRTRAFRTSSDVYAFHGLPGLRDLEYPTGAAATDDDLLDDALNASPPRTRGFVVEVRDRKARYLPAAFRVDLPLPDPGLFLVSPLTSPADGGPPGFFLFATPTRPAPVWLGVVRGELIVAASGQPAAHALVRVELPGPAVYFGLADGAGRFAVFLHYPAPLELLGGSPAGSGPQSLGQSTWPITVEVFHSPSLHEPLAGTDLPSYPSLLHQSPAEILSLLPAEGGVPEATWTGELRFREQRILRTERDTRLWIVPGDSSP